MSNSNKERIADLLYLESIETQQKNGRSSLIYEEGLLLDI